MKMTSIEITPSANLKNPCNSKDEYEKVIIINSSLNCKEISSSVLNYMLKSNISNLDYSLPDNVVCLFYEDKDHTKYRNISIEMINEGYFLTSVDTYTIESGKIGKRDIIDDIDSSKIQFMNIPNEVQEKDIDVEIPINGIPNYYDYTLKDIFSSKFREAIESGFSAKVANFQLYKVDKTYKDSLIDKYNQIIHSILLGDSEKLVDSINELFGKDKLKWWTIASCFFESDLKYNKDTEVNTNSNYLNSFKILMSKVKLNNSITDGEFSSSLIDDDEVKSMEPITEYPKVITTDNNISISNNKVKLVNIFYELTFPINNYKCIPLVDFYRRTTTSTSYEDYMELICKIGGHVTDFRWNPWVNNPNDINIDIPSLGTDGATPFDMNGLIPNGFYAVDYNSNLQLPRNGGSDRGYRFVDMVGCDWKPTKKDFRHNGGMGPFRGIAALHHDEARIAGDLSKLKPYGYVTISEVSDIGPGGYNSKYTKHISDKLIRYKNTPYQSLDDTPGLIKYYQPSDPAFIYIDKTDTYTFYNKGPSDRGDYEMLINGRDRGCDLGGDKMIYGGRLHDFYRWFDLGEQVEDLRTPARFFYGTRTDITSSICFKFNINIINYLLGLNILNSLGSPTTGRPFEISGNSFDDDNVYSTGEHFNYTIYKCKDGYNSGVISKSEDMGKVFEDMDKLVKPDRVNRDLHFNMKFKGNNSRLIKSTEINNIEDKLVTETKDGIVDIDFRNTSRVEINDIEFVRSGNIDKATINGKFELEFDSPENSTHFVKLISDVTIINDEWIIDHINHIHSNEFIKDLIENVSKSISNNYKVITSFNTYMMRDKLIQMYG